MSGTEPTIKKISCSYCGDAPIHHLFSYIGGLIFISVDNHVVNVASRAPKFLRSFVDWLHIFLFKTLAFLKLVRFSSDIERANTFRSRVIWEEAERRGIKMEQVILFGKPLDFYRATLNEPKRQKIYFESLPIPPNFLYMRKNWDDKFILKEELHKHDIPVPLSLPVSIFFEQNLEQIFEKFKKPVIVKPKVGSRGRHTITNINTMQEFFEGVGIVKQICPYVVVEEHLSGYVCRATLVDGVLAGFYRGHAPFVVGDGKKNMRELIEEKDKNRQERVERVQVGEELHRHIARSGFKIDDVVPEGIAVSLTHRVGRLFGGTTKEMLDELHPSFTPIFERAVKMLGLGVAGFDAIIPDPTKPADSQRWGIIECNTLPFIDLHYYALEGKPKNIAGMIWDFWK